MSHFLINRLYFNTLIFLLVLFFVNIGWSQMIGPIPPTPTATSLAQYGEIPVKKFIGSPDIQIPLYNIQENDIQIPISLGYQATGIRVEEIASFAGLKWNLMAGGSITRAVRGKPDEDAPFGYFFQADDINAIAAKNKGNWTSADMDALIDFADGTRDSAPDLFYFNFPGYSGQFIYDENQAPHTIPYKDLIIEKTTGATGIESFIVTSEDGTKYYFGFVDGRAARDRTTTRFECFGVDHISNDIANTSWHLLKIESITGEIVEFFYDTGYSLSYVNQNASASILYQVNAGRQWRSNRGCFSDFSMSGRHLSRIQSDNVLIDFNSSQSRQDITGDYQLDDIVIKSRQSGSIIKSYHMTYGYYNPTGSTEEKRLRLDQVTESGRGGLEKPPYVFDYDPGTLPSRNSKAQDHWGFYNGENTNDQSVYGLVPEEIQGRQFNGGGNRTTGPNYVDNGVLRTIHYPTGGSTTFEYEANRHTVFRPVTFEDCANGNAQGCGPRIASALTNCTATSCSGDSDTFTITQTQEIFLTVNFNLSALPPGLQIECDAYLTLKDDMGNPVDVQMVDPPYSYYSSWFCADYRSGTNSPRQFRGFLTPGTYRIAAFVGARWEGVTSRITVNYVEFTDDFDPNAQIPITEYVGGLRVTRIIDSDDMSSANDIVRKYEYNDAHLITQPQYLTEFTNTLNESYEVARSQSYVALGSASGSPICYGEVIEIMGETGSNGKVTTRFTYSPDVNYPYRVALPFIPRLSTDWKRGLLRQEIISHQNGERVSFREVDNNFNETRNKTVLPYYVVGDLAVVSHANYPTKTSARFDVYQIDQVSQWVYQNSELSRSYAQGDPTKYVEESITYHYDNANHSQLTRVEKQDSEGDLTVTKLKYPLDYSPSGIITTLQNDHILNKPIEQFNLTNGKINYASKFDYSSTGGNIFLTETYKTDLYPPVLEANFNPTSYIPDANLKYNTHGNLIEAKNKDGIIVTYLWGYNYTLPVAEIIGAAYSDVTPFINITTLQSLDGSTLLNTINGLRGNLPESQIKAFSYDPLFGMTATTDPNGRLSTFVYDDLGRLMYIKDFDGNILQENKYHYKGQPE